MNSDLNPDDIIKPVDGYSSAIGLEICQASKITEMFEHFGTLTTDEGVACSVLKVGENWKSGKIRVKLEFIPD